MTRWKEIPGYPGYFASAEGEIAKVADNLLFKMKSRPDINGYRVVDLKKNGRYHTKKVHRLVLETFVGPCPKGYQCDHINTVRDDNRLSNLHWVTCSENHRNPITRQRKMELGVLGNRVLCVETGEVFTSVSNAARKTGASRSHIGEVCKGKARSTGGLTFVYVEVRHGRS